MKISFNGTFKNSKKKFDKNKGKKKKENEQKEKEIIKRKRKKKKMAKPRWFPCAKRYREGRKGVAVGRWRLV